MKPSYDISTYKAVRALTEAICNPLKLEDYIPQPVDFVSPPKWHLAHTTWFFEEFILKHHLSGYQEFHPDFSFMFNSYYNAIGKRVFRADRGNMTRPTLDEVFIYRSYVDENMLILLKTGLNDEIESLLEIGLNHEQQHQELLITDLKFILGNNPLFPVYKIGGSMIGDQNESNKWCFVDAGMYEIGCSDSGFSFDNEHHRHKVYLDDFEINKGLVTNGEFMEFMDAGSYSNHGIWLDDGWTWVNKNGISAPLYWHRIDGEWHHFTLGGLLKVDPDSILSHVSHYEAAAFAEWKKMRLPTEAEWEIASEQFDWGKRWEHTNSAYLAYPGYKKPAGAVGEYNGKFMMNQMVLRGGSVATSPGHSRKTYRNFFYPSMQWQFSGIRLVRNG